MEKSIFFDVALYLYLAASFLYILWHLYKSKVLAFLGTAFLVLGFLAQSTFIVERWQIAGYPPLSNSFETLVFFSWAVVLQYLILETVGKARFLGSAASLLAFVILAYSTLFPSAVRPLMPALQNNFWLTVHVILCFVSYASFAISFLAALWYLVKKGEAHQGIALYLIALLIVSLSAGLTLTYLYKTGRIALTLDFVTAAQVIFAFLVLASVVWFPLFWLAESKTAHEDDEKLQVFIYKAIAFGFPFLTMGILSGAVWANKAWGRYWGWDPKETWSLVTWFVYAFYLHARFVVGWKGARLAWCAVAGFIAVLFTYFGVNYLLTGLHSYA